MHEISKGSTQFMRCARTVGGNNGDNPQLKRKLTEKFRGNRSLQFLVERKEGVPFYRMGEGAGHGRGRNGDRKHGGRPWKAGGNGSAVPGVRGHKSRGKLGNQRGRNGD